jgi:twinkle protein
MKYLQLNDLQDRLIKYLKTDIKTYSVGFRDIDEHYKILLGNCTDITGYPYSGKTLFLMEILYNLSEEHGFKHLLHLPDSGKPEEVMALLFQKRTGLTFDKRYSNVIDETTIMKEIHWIDEHFKILDYTKRPSPKEYWDYAAKENFHTASIDSWNYMRHEGEGTKYLADILSYRNEIAEKYNKHFFTIIHPRNPNGHDYDSDGKLKAPDVFNLMGGSEWNNNGKNIVVVHKESKESFNYDIYFRKIKPRIVGKTGFTTLQYDIKNQKFFEFDENNLPMFAFGIPYEEEAYNTFGGFPDTSAPF